MEKVLLPQHPETFHSKPKWFLGKKSKYSNKKQSTWQCWCVLVPLPYSSCHSIAFCVAAMYFVPQHCAVCHSNALCAATMFFVPQHCATCHIIVLHAMIKLFIPWQENDMPWHCMALFFVLWQEMMHCSIAQCSAPSFLCTSARDNLLLHSTACCIMPWHCALCFVLQPSLSCRNHVSLCHGKKQCTTAWQHHGSHFGLGGCGF